MPEVTNDEIILALSYIIPKDVFEIEKGLGVFPFDIRVHRRLFQLRLRGLVECGEKHISPPHPFAVLSPVMLEYSLTKEGIKYRRLLQNGGVPEDQDDIAYGVLILPSRRKKRVKKGKCWAGRRPSQKTPSRRQKLTQGGTAKK